MNNPENTEDETVILTSEQALIFYGVESSKPFQINASLANVGEMLRHAREHREISIELLGDKINLDPEIIRQIEANRYQNIAAETFVKGYINLIARELGADSGPVLQVYEVLKRLGDPTPPNLNATRKSEARGSAVVFSIIGAAIIIAAVIYYYRYSTIMDESTRLQEKQLKSLEISISDNVLGSYGFSTPPLSKVDENGTEAETGELTLRAKNGTWIEIVDDHGVVLYRDLVNANQTLELLGNPPYNLLIENGSAIDIEYQGQAINFSSAVNADGIARFRLGDF